MSNLDGLTSGQSTRLTIVDIDGVKNFSIIEAFSASENANIPDHTAMDGITRHPKFHMGWSGSFTYQRGSPALDNYIASSERNYYEGGDQVDATITQTISELDGTKSEWQFTGCVFMLTDGGQYSGTDIVKQSVTFKAKRKIRLL